MRKEDSHLVTGAELPVRLKELGYNIDPAFVEYIPIGERGHRCQRGVLTNGKIPSVWYYELENVKKFLDDLAEYNLTARLKERGYEIRPGWEKYFPREFIDGKYCYNLEKVILYLNSITICNIKDKLKELGYDIDDDYAYHIRLYCGSYANSADKSFSCLKLEEVVDYINSANRYNLEEKLKERGYVVDRHCLRRIKDEYDLYDYSKSPHVFDLEKVVGYIINHPIIKVKMNNNELPEDDPSKYFSGDRLKDLYGLTGNSFSHFPILKWYSEKYNTIPDVCHIGEIYIDDLLEDEDYKVRWSYKGFTDYSGEEHMGHEMLRMFERDQMCEYFMEALVEIEDGMFLLLYDGELDPKNEFLQAIAVLFYKEGKHDPSDILHFVSDKYVTHDDRGSLGLLFHGRNGFSTRDFTIPMPVIDFNLNYNKGFEEVNNTIYLALSMQKGKGLVLLHGKPGTGKTTYIRYLINRLNKNKIFIPPNLTEMLSDPGFIPFLMDNPDCVLFVEDAENVLRSREDGQNNQAVSNILNITDGLLSDCLNIQIVATFNTHLKNIDEALLRKGRLIAQYEFTSLKPDRAEMLADSLNVWLDDTDDLTLADIYAAKAKKTQG